MTATPVCFYVYPKKGSRLRAKVFVYPTLRDMRNAVAALDSMDTSGSKWPSRLRSRLGGHTAGITERHRKTKRITPTFAWIFIADRTLRMGTITHECVHAACRYLARTGVESLPTNRGGVGNVAAKEEQLAYAIDAMAQQVVHRCRERGLIP